MCGKHGVLTLSISIHALLAESDGLRPLKTATGNDFYPRSPCGERPAPVPTLRILSNFYPRSPCGERRLCRVCPPSGRPFLSTLSLRRATALWFFVARKGQISIHALLAESDGSTTLTFPGFGVISIHALLAESDFTCGFSVILII